MNDGPEHRPARPDANEPRDEAPESAAPTGSSGSAGAPSVPEASSASGTGSSHERIVPDTSDASGASDTSEASDGPDASRGFGAGGSADADGAPGPFGAAAGPVPPPGDRRMDAFDDAELALRSLLHGAVGELRPSPQALDHLRRAVPARRARKRQALVGAAAAAVLACTAVPALVHVAGSGGGTDNTAIAGHGQASDGAGDDGKSSGEGPADKVKPTGKAPADQGGGKNDKGGADPDKGTVQGSGGGTDSSSGTPDEAVAACGAAQLGGASSMSAGTPDAEGKVYGTFRIVNVSAAPCTVAGPGTVSTLAAGAADPSRVTAVRHTSGDAATGLPDPSAEQSALLLQPNEAYDVKFAWVPSESCPSTGASPDPSPTGGTTGTGETTGSQGVQTQLADEDPGTADGRVQISYTAVGGASTGTTISDACAGTVYYTGVLAAS